MECPHCNTAGDQYFRREIHREVMMMSTSCIKCGHSFNYTPIVEPPRAPKPVAAKKPPQDGRMTCAWPGCKAKLNYETKGSLCYAHKRIQNRLDRLARRDQTHNQCSCGAWTKKPETVCYGCRLEAARKRKFDELSTEGPRICIGYKEPCRDQKEISRTNKSGRCRRCDGLKRSAEYRLKKAEEKEGAGHDVR